MKLYLIYAKIPLKLYTRKMKFLLPMSNKHRFTMTEDGNYYAGLFLKSREGAKEMYQVVKVKPTEEEFEEFRKEHLETHLVYYLIPHHTEHGEDYFAFSFDEKDEDNMEISPEGFYKNNISPDNFRPLLCTKTEFNEALENGPTYLSEYLSNIVTTNYMVFSPEYINALDRFGYCDEYNALLASPKDESEEEEYQEYLDYMNYQSSFNLTALGNKKYLDMYENRFFLLLSLYFEMFMGYDERYQIRLVV